MADRHWLASVLGALGLGLGNKKVLPIDDDTDPNRPSLRGFMGTMGSMGAPNGLDDGPSFARSGVPRPEGGGRPWRSTFQNILSSLAMGPELTDPRATGFGADVMRGFQGSLRGKLAMEEMQRDRAKEYRKEARLDQAEKRYERQVKLQEKSGEREESTLKTILEKHQQSMKIGDLPLQDRASREAYLKQYPEKFAIFDHFETRHWLENGAPPDKYEKTTDYATFDEKGKPVIKRVLRPLRGQPVQDVPLGSPKPTKDEEEIMSRYKIGRDDPKFAGLLKETIPTLREEFSQRERIAEMHRRTAQTASVYGVERAAHEAGVGRWQMDHPGEPVPKDVQRTPEYQAGRGDATAGYYGARGEAARTAKSDTAKIQMRIKIYQGLIKTLPFMQAMKNNPKQATHLFNQELRRVGLEDAVSEEDLGQLKAYSLQESLSPVPSGRTSPEPSFSGGAPKSVTGKRFEDILK